MGSALSIAVVGADGFVGGALADALCATRIVYGPPRDGDVHVTRCAAAVGAADVVVTAHGFRVRPGCTLDDYRSSHERATSAIVPFVRPGALLLHVSSASVLGRGENLGNAARPHPSSFPAPNYALAKLEEDEYLERVTADGRFRVIRLRPAVLYSRRGAGMVDTVLKLARRGVFLRLYPREARHHLCSMELLADVARRVIDRADLPHLTSLVVADPYTVTNAELEALLRPARRRRGVPVPLPLPWVSAILRRAWSSRLPALDLRTRGEIFGVLHMDTVYDPSATFSLLGIDPLRYALERTLQPLVAEALRS